MKKTLLLSMVFLFIGLVSLGQAKNEKMVPQVVKDQFAKDFPDASNKRWHRAGKDFKMTMQHNNKHSWVRYTKEGRMRWVCHTWKGLDVPSNLTDKILADFPGFKANWATETESPNLKKHQFLVRLSKPGFVLKVLMNADGTYAKEDSDDLKKD